MKFWVILITLLIPRTCTILIRIQIMARWRTLNGARGQSLANTWDMLFADIAV